MLTPVEMQGRTLKGGFGYKKNEVDNFLEEIFESYEKLYKENADLKEKLAVLNDGLQYYKDLENTLQKTLLVAEKTAESTKNASMKKAAAIEKNATIKAQMTLSDTKKTMDKIQNQTIVLMQQFENYRQQYKQILNAQMELLDSKAYSLPPFEPITLDLPSFDATADTEDLAAVAKQLAEVEIEEFSTAAREVMECMEEQISSSETNSMENMPSEHNAAEETVSVAEDTPLPDVPPQSSTDKEASPAFMEDTSSVTQELPLEKISLELSALPREPEEVEDSFEFLDI